MPTTVETTFTSHAPKEGLMEHVVFFPGPDGSPAFRRFGSLEDAVRFVEHLRNVEGVSDFSVHALSAVPLAFRAYYKVEVGAEAQFVAEAQPAAEAVAEVPAQAEPVLEAVPLAAEPVMPEPQFATAEYAEAGAAAEQPSNGKRSLGFFAH
jgi:hypothetical protein